jgi:hypothetical protein
MTRKEALAELIAKVEAGEIAASDFDAFVPVFNVTTTGNDAHMAYRGSLDAAKALHEAVLHERVFVEIEWSKRYNDEARVTISLGENGWYAGSGTPARAWLLAILKALHGMETEQ